MKTMNLWFWAPVFFCAACSGTNSQSGDQGPGAADQGVEMGSTDGGAGGPCPQSPCGAETVCYQGDCLLHQGHCQSDEDCLNDSFCHQGFCLGYQDAHRTHDPDCLNEGFEPEALKEPVVKCSWTESGSASTPMVVDLDGDAYPEIVFAHGTKVTAIRVPEQGDVCQVVFEKEANLYGSAHLAVADLDGDGHPEIMGIDQENRVVLMDHEGEVLTSSEPPASGMNKNLCTGPAVANLDGQGNAEIVYAGMALSYDGSTLTSLFDEVVPRGGVYDIVLSAVADLDLDGQPEVLTGNRILDGLTGTDKTPETVKGWESGYVAVGDFDSSTTHPEVVLVSSGKTAGEVRIFDPLTGDVFFGPYPVGPKLGGAPTVADFDGDGAPEVAVAGYDGYYVFDPECAVDPLPSFCAKEGVRWFKVTHDYSSASTGSSVFDFNGDGRAEVVYRDECWLRVYDGVDGSVRFAHEVTSGTGTEMPVIADVDNDGHAEIVVNGTNYVAKDGCPDESELGLTHSQTATPGVFILQDPADQWMPSRAIWNQHTYHITNINDDATVPQTEENNWETHNNYRQNVQGFPGPVPGADLTARWYPDIDASTDCDSAWVLQVEVCNRGPAKAPGGVVGTFYLGDPQAGGEALCSTKTMEVLEAGACTVVQCVWEEPSTNTIDLYFVADADQQQFECKEQNNLMFEQFKCPGTVE